MDFSTFAVLVVVARGFVLAATIVMAGAVVFHRGVLARWPAAPPAPLHQWSERTARSGVAAAACIVVLAPARLFAQARGLVVPGDPILPMMGNVMHTMWGRGWVLQTAASLCALAGLVLARRGSRGGWPLAFASTLGVTLSPALMGHAIAAERLLVVSVLSDWVHVAMAGAWLGTLAMLALVARVGVAATAPAAASDTAVATLIDLFHPIALICSATLVATGVISLLLRVDHLGDLPHSAYGAILAVKLTLTLGVAAFGLHHSRRGANRVRLGQAAHVARSLAAETVLAGMVIAATAVLVGTSPPMRMDMTARAANEAAHVPSEVPQ